MTSLLVAAALTAASPQALPIGSASPAMFVVEDADTKVFIFGTFHALDGKVDWFRDDVKAAFDQSDELILETVVPDPGTPIRIQAGAGFRPLPVTPSASFLGTTRLAINVGKSQGMSVAHGADMVLRHAAEIEGKPVEGLETLESQLTMFAQLPPAPVAPPPRPGMPVENADAVESLSRAMMEMQSAWARGDQGVFVRMLGDLQRASPDTYRMMFTERNGRWADWIAGRMQTPGTVFLAVGAGHLAGKDSLLVRLAELRIESTRTQ